MVLKAFGSRRQYRWEDELAILRCSSSLMTDTLDLVTECVEKIPLVACYATSILLERYTVSVIEMVKSSIAPAHKP